MSPLHHMSHSLEALNRTWNNISDSQVVLNDDFSKLIILVLQCNLLTSVPFVKKIAANLVLLDLSHNSIDSLENIYNVQFLKLHALCLTYNSVRNISLSELYMPKLYALHLGHNLLLNMEPVDEILNGFPGGYHQLLVYIGDNPWHCDESLSWLYDRNIINKTMIVLVFHVQAPQTRFPLLMSIRWYATHQKHIVENSTHHEVSYCQLMLLRLPVEAGLCFYQ